MKYPLSEFRKKRRFVALKRLILVPVARALSPFAPNPRPFEITRHTLKLPKLTSSIKLVQLSDLHLGPQLMGASVAAWVDANLQESPDIIVITGDFLDYSARGLEDESLTELARLKAPLGVWATWGNQDYLRSESELDELRGRLESYGIRVLVNESATLRDDLVLSGLDDILEGEPSLDFLTDTPDQAQIFLGHSPDVLPLLPPSIDVALFGHTHGGQIRLPLVGAIETSSKYAKDFLEGWVGTSPKAYVSRGLGTTGVPLRVGVKAELMVMRLEPG